MNCDVPTKKNVIFHELEMQTHSFIWLFKQIKPSPKDRISYLSVPFYFLETSGSFTDSENLVLGVPAALKLNRVGEKM